MPPLSIAFKTEIIKELNKFNKEVKYFGESMHQEVGWDCCNVIIDDFVSQYVRKHF